jgi:hypothetical protein
MKHDHNDGNVKSEKWKTGQLLKLIIDCSNHFKMYGRFSQNTADMT